MDQGIISNIVATLIAAGALIISLLVYVRRRSVETENFFFQHKVQAYSEIITAASTALEQLHKGFADVRTEMYEDKPHDKIIYDSAVAIDVQMALFRVAMHKSCAFIPQDIVEGFNSFYDQAFKQSEVLDAEKISKKMMEDAIEVLGGVEEKLDTIINLMRKDLGIQTIDLRLKRRTV